MRRERGRGEGRIRTRGCGCCKSHSTSLPETIAVKFFKLQFYYHTHTHTQRYTRTHRHTLTHTDTHATASAWKSFHFFPFYLTGLPEKLVEQIFMKILCSSFISWLLSLSLSLYSLPLSLHKQSQKSRSTLFLVCCLLPALHAPCPPTGYCHYPVTMTANWLFFVSFECLSRFLLVESRERGTKPETPFRLPISMNARVVSASRLTGWRAAGQTGRQEGVS